MFMAFLELSSHAGNQPCSPTVNDCRLLLHLTNNLDQRYTAGVWKMDYKTHFALCTARPTVLLIGEGLILVCGMSTMKRFFHWLVAHSGILEKSVLPAQYIMV